MPRSIKKNDLATCQPNEFGKKIKNKRNVSNTAQSRPKNRSNQDQEIEEMFEKTTKKSKAQQIYDDMHLYFRDLDRPVGFNPMLPVEVASAIWKETSSGVLVGATKQEKSWLSNFWVPREALFGRLPNVRICCSVPVANIYFVFKIFRTCAGELDVRAGEEGVYVEEEGVRIEEE
ncbi:13620_t:CDS:2, partial [Ambispora leptoticha]